MPYQIDIYDALGIPPPWKKRKQNDFYPTPALLTQALIKQVEITGNVFEPCAGNCDISAVFYNNPQTPTVLESDLTWDNNHPVDATTKKFWQYWQQQFTDNGRSLDWVVTNPPFNQAHLILPLAFNHCQVGCAFLLRSTYSEPCRNRAQWLIETSDRLRYRLDINPRPQFRSEKGNDLATCTWFVWLKNWSWKEKGITPPFGFITNWKK